MFYLDYAVPAGVKGQDAAFHFPQVTAVPTKVAELLQVEEWSQTELSPLKDEKVLHPVKTYEGKRRIVSTAESTLTTDNTEASAVSETLVPPVEVGSSTKLGK
ncbi:uncharacterized protein LOC108742480 [Agrilus planipennis]|uniref:Uncharacterized protein LOC108742480 n=1 Tax=Agrilus planipennis TaxID=224129 RepID=A0A7F5R7R9_AGRPL|nr:uncharacterized protein LOC108742480 [Agrilus planipennis]